MAVAIALVLAGVVGLFLGLLGGGGSILTVPILSYVLGMGAQEAIASSLFIVGATSLISLTGHIRAKRVNFRAGLVFGLASMVGAYFGGLLGTMLPGVVLMMLFALMMLSTAIGMLRPRKESETPTGFSWTKNAIIGLTVGAITGLVGAGGGFLIVPALVLFAGLSMQVAVGTSLLVIVLKSFASFAGYMSAITIDWPIVLAFTAVASVFSLVGVKLISLINPQQLRKIFGWFVLLMGVFVLVQETLTLLS